MVVWSQVELSEEDITITSEGCLSQCPHPPFLHDPPVELSERRGTVVLLVVMVRSGMSWQEISVSLRWWWWWRDSVS